MEKPKICLTMIVKNESRIIERLLDSVKEIVDCVSICDTGSEDNTVIIIEEFLKKNAIPGKVYNEPWQNFAYNRTHSARLAEQTLIELKFPLENTYLLQLDADMILKVDPAFDKQALNADAYLLIQTTSYVSFYNRRLLRASLEWKAVGLTHEYWTSELTDKYEKLHTLSIDDREDGGCKTDKFERDIRLLTQGIVEEPNNERYYFYLAQTYKALGKNEEAIKWYKERIKNRDMNEEVWFSKLMIGIAYGAINNWNEALQWLLEAYQDNPTRAEPLYAIALYYRLTGKKNLAHIFATQGSQIPYPKDHFFFIFDNIYNYQFDEELSFIADNTHFTKEGNDAATRLLLKKSVPDFIKDQTYKNLLNFVENLPNAHFDPIVFENKPVIYQPHLFKLKNANLFTYFPKSAF